jgi:glycosyltransferase involved in cell wall biosynthesis
MNPDPVPQTSTTATPPPSSPVPGDADRLRNRRIVFAANTAWYLHNHHRTVLRAFLDAGAQVYALAPEGPRCEELAAEGCRVVPLPITPSSRNPLREARSFAAFVALYRKIRPDAAFHYTIKCNVYGGAAARLLGVPYVNNVPGLGSAFRNGGLMRFAARTALRVAQRDAARVFLQNPDDAGFMRRNGLVSEAQITLVPGSGVDLDRFAPATPSEGAPDRPVVFVYAGRLLREKGLAELAEAMRRVREIHPGASCRVYGFPQPGDARYVQRDELARWEDEGFVEFRGPLDDVRPAYAEADCVVLPTYYREGVPKSLLEAAAMAKPIVATSLAGCRAVVREGETGFLCEPRDVTSLAAALSRAIEAGPQGRAEMGRKGRALAEAAFGSERVARAYLDAAVTLMPASARAAARFE